MKWEVERGNTEFIVVLFLLFIIFDFQLLDGSAMPQQARDGDEMMNMIVDEEDWKLLLC